MIGETATTTLLSRSENLGIGIAQRVQSDWAAELAVFDLSWVAGASARYSSALRKAPQTFAWEDSSEMFATLQILQRSTTLRRLRSCLHFIGAFDSRLAQSMTETFDALPVIGKLRFMTAPETFSSITALRREPALSVMQLCTFLNGESAFHRLGPAKPGYCTALGDLYYSESMPVQAEAACDNEGLNIHALRAPRLVDSLPIDFFSPNVQLAKETSGAKGEVAEFGVYSPEEVSLVSAKLQDVFDRIEKVSIVAAQLIREFVKVIIPLKVASGHGSTSQPRFPGRVLLRGVEHAPHASVASALVHEAMHQLLYILEFAGEFVVVPVEKEEEKPIVKSLWTGRDLALHSFIHACFIWYGLVRFWVRPAASEVFESRQVDVELARCASGFRGRNPVEVLLPHEGRVRYDVVRIAATLQDQVLPILPTTAAA